jgi:hypothetical protein
MIIFKIDIAYVSNLAHACNTQIIVCFCPFEPIRTIAFLLYGTFDQRFQPAKNKFCKLILLKHAYFA